MFSASLVASEGVYSGKIVVKSKNSQFKVTVPYHARVFQGSLLLDEESTQFFLPDVDNNGKVRHHHKLKGDTTRSRAVVEKLLLTLLMLGVPVINCAAGHLPNCPAAA